MRTRLFYFIAILLGLALTACATIEPVGGPTTPSGDGDTLPADSASEATIETFFVGPERVDCVGVGPQECLQVRRGANAEFELFYDEISGFTFEPGYTYELRVRVQPVENPPADASSLAYELVETVSREAAEAGADVEADTDVEAGTSMSLEGTQWTLVSFSDAEVPYSAGDAPVTARFEDGRVGGKAACNNYNTGYKLLGSGVIELNEIATTLMACPEPIMQVEDAFLKAFATASAYTVDDNTLTIIHDSGELIFEADAE